MQFLRDNVVRYTFYIRNSRKPTHTHTQFQIHLLSLLLHLVYIIIFSVFDCAIGRQTDECLHTAHTHGNLPLLLLNYHVNAVVFLVIVFVLFFSLMIQANVYLIDCRQWHKIYTLNIITYLKH